MPIEKIEEINIIQTWKLYKKSVFFSNGLQFVTYLLCNNCLDICCDTCFNMQSLGYPGYVNSIGLVIPNIASQVNMVTFKISFFFLNF